MRSENWERKVHGFVEGLCAESHIYRRSLCGHMTCQYEKTRCTAFQTLFCASQLHSWLFKVVSVTYIGWYSRATFVVFVIPIPRALNFRALSYCISIIVLAYCGIACCIKSFFFVKENRTIIKKKLHSRHSYLMEVVRFEYWLWNGSTLLWNLPFQDGTLPMRAKI